MAWTFQQGYTATLKAKDANSNSSFSVGGVNATLSDPADAVNQLNKILNIGGQSAVVDANTKLTVTKGAIDNGN